MTAAIAPATATSGPGTPGATRRSPMITASESVPTSSVSPCVSPRCVISRQACSKKSPCAVADPEQLRQLADDDRQRQADDEALQHGLADEVGQEAEPQQAREQGGDAGGERQRGRQRGETARRPPGRDRRPSPPTAPRPPPSARRRAPASCPARRRAPARPARRRGRQPARHARCSRTRAPGERGSPTASGRRSDRREATAAHSLAARGRSASRQTRLVVEHLLCGAVRRQRGRVDRITPAARSACTGSAAAAGAGFGRADHGGARRRHRPQALSSPRSPRRQVDPRNAGVQDVECLVGKRVQIAAGLAVDPRRPGELAPVRPDRIVQATAGTGSPAGALRGSLLPTRGVTVGEDSARED